TQSVFTRDYPRYDEKLASVDEIEIGVQINGKLRGTITISVDDNQDNALELASADRKISRWLEGRTIKKVIYVRGKILNIILE
ncbi:hypothetical protein DRQ29_01000, partial [bacterium]